MSGTGWEHIQYNLCGADDTILAARKFGMTVVRCQRCSLVYTNPRPSVAEMRRRVQAVRRRPDEEIIRLFHIPSRPTLRTPNMSRFGGNWSSSFNSTSYLVR